MNKMSKDINKKIGVHVNIKDTWTILVNNKIFNTEEQKSNFYYKILINKKFEINYMEKVWEKAFDIDIPWNLTYQTQVWDVKERKLGEFNYKLICNIINTRNKIAKWNNDVTPECQYCQQEHSTKHLLYECPRVANLWQLIGSFLKLDVQYRHIVIDNTVTNDYIESRNLFISYTAYAIYKFWILAENKKVRYNTDSLHNFVKKDLFQRTLYVKNDGFNAFVDGVIELI